MSLYRAYFVITGLDPDGLAINLVLDDPVTSPDGTCWDFKEKYTLQRVYRAVPVGLPPGIIRLRDAIVIRHIETALEGMLKAFERNQKVDCEEGSVCCYTHELYYRRSYLLAVEVTSTRNKKTVMFMAVVAYNAVLKSGVCVEKDLFEFCGGCPDGEPEIEIDSDLILMPGPGAKFEFDVDLFVPEPEPPKPEPPLG